MMVSLLGALASPVAAFEEINKSFPDEIALSGFDALSFFNESQPVKGDKAFVVQWKGAKWLFKNEANRSRFAAEPAAFAPQYGGHCSNQMSLGNLSDIDPNIWLEINGKIYFFGHEAGRKRWSKETGTRIREADAHWKFFLNR